MSCPKGLSPGPPVGSGRKGKALPMAAALVAVLAMPTLALADRDREESGHHRQRWDSHRQYDRHHDSGSKVRVTYSEPSWGISVRIGDRDRGRYHRGHDRGYGHGRAPHCDGYYKRVWVPPVYRTYYDCGYRRTVLIRCGYYRTVFVACDHVGYGGSCDY